MTKIGYCCVGTNNLDKVSAMHSVAAFCLHGAPSATLTRTNSRVFEQAVGFYTTVLGVVGQQVVMDVGRGKVFRV